MDRNYWVRDYEQRVEEWREQRVQKMAARLQLHSNRQRTVSSSVLGYGNHRQQASVQLNQRQHNEGPRYNHVDQRWNPNYNYTGYREQNSPHNQYHYTGHRRPRSFHQHAYKKEHFSSQKSLYNKRLTNTSDRKYSSCSNINGSTSKTENEIVLQSFEPNTETVNEKGIESKVHLDGESSSQININIGESLIPIPSSGGVNSVIEQDVQVNEPILDYEPTSEVAENDVSESCRQVDFSSDITVNVDKVVENLDSLSSAELGEIYSPMANTSVNTDNCLVEEVDIIGEHLLVNSNIEVGGNESFKPLMELEGVNPTTILLEVETAYDNMLSEPQYKIHEDLSLEQQNMSDPIRVSPVTIHIENGDESSVLEPQMRTHTECPLTFEEASDITDTPKVKEIFSESITSEENGAIADGFQELDFSLSFEPEKELIVEDSTSEQTIEASELETEVAIDTESFVKSTDEEREETSSEIESTHVVPVALIVTGDSETEPCILIGDENDIAKEIEKVENKLSNISIDNKNICNDAELITPKKKERRKVFLDATNILQSSAIKYSVQEVRKNDDSEIIVTPVRRSLRISSMTPVSNKNRCVQNLKELTPEVIQKMKFVNNPAIKTPPS